MSWLIGIGALLLFGFLIKWWTKKKLVKNYLSEGKSKNNIESHMDHFIDHGGIFQDKNQNR